MAIVNREANCDLDAWLAKVGNSNFGNGAGGRIQIGYANVSGEDWLARGVFRIPIAAIMPADRQLATAIVDFEVLGTQSCFSQGGSPKFVLEELDVPDPAVPFTENGESATCAVSGSGAATAKYPGPAVLAANRVVWQGTPAAGSTISVSILAMAEAARVAGKTHLAFRLAACSATGVLEETTSSRRIAVASSETGTPAKLRISFDDNQPPNAPSNLLPVALTIVSTTEGDRVTITGSFSDPDAGNYLKSATAEVYASTVLQAQIDAGTAFPLKTSTVIPGGSPQTFSILVSALSKRTDLQYRVRVRDQGDAYGPWSPLIAFRTNATPQAPANPVVTRGTAEPNFLGSIVSNDPSEFGTAAEVQVYEDPAAGDTITKWASGKQAIGGDWTRFSLAYGTGGSSTPLELGKEYRYRMRVWDRDDAVGAWSAYFYFTPTLIVGPTDMAPVDTSEKEPDTTPDLVITDDANFDRWELEVYDNEDGIGTALWDIPLQTIASTLTTTRTYGNMADLVGAGAAAALQPGGSYWWRARIRLTGDPDVGSWSPLHPFYINATPGKPSPLSVVSGFQKADGTWVVADDTPTVVFPFVDSDIARGYIEAPVRREVEMRTLADAHVAGSPFIVVGAPDDTFEVPAAVLPFGQTRKVRARYDDNDNARSAFSDYLTLKASSPPVLAVVTPVDNSVVTDPTTLITWTSDLAQSQKQIVLTDITAGRDERHDSGVIDGGILNYVLPPFRPDGTPLQQDGHEYEIAVTSWSEDGLPTTLVWTYTTDFAVPSAPTGLVLTADTEDGAIDLAWDASADPLFAAWVIEVSGDLIGTFRRADEGELLTPGATSYRIYDLPNNRDVTIRVRQHNGALASLPAEAVIRVPMYDMQFVVPGDPAHTFDLRLLDGFPKSYPAPQDTMIAFGRRNAIASKGMPLGASGSISATIPSESWWKIERLREMQALAEPIILKDGFGSVIKASLGDLVVTPGEFAVQTITMQYQQVED